MIDRRNLTFNHSVDAKSSQEEIRSERFKERFMWIGRLSEIFQECLQKSKNTSFYRKKIRRNRPIGAFQAPSTV